MKKVNVKISHGKLNLFKILLYAVPNSRKGNWVPGHLGTGDLRQNDSVYFYFRLVLSPYTCIGTLLMRDNRGPVYFYFGLLK